MSAPQPVSSPPMALEPAWIDYNGHLNMAYYNVLFDRGMDVFFEVLGMGPTYRERRGLTTYSAEAHVRYLKEVPPQAMMTVTTQLIDHDAKRLHTWAELRFPDDTVSATCECMTLHIDQTGGPGGTPKVAAFPDDVMARIEAEAERQSGLQKPDALGRPIGIVRR